MEPLNFDTDIAPMRGKYFDPLGQAAVRQRNVPTAGLEKLNQYQRGELTRLYDEQAEQRRNYAAQDLEMRKQQAYLDRERQLLLDDAQKKRRQAEIDQKLRPATKALNRALKGESLEDKALGVLEVQSRFAELAGTNPAFQILVDAANRKLGLLMREEDQKQAASLRGVTTQKVPQSEMVKWQSDFNFLSEIAKKAPDTAFGGSAIPTYASEDLNRLSRIAAVYGIDPDQYEDPDELISDTYTLVRKNAPTESSYTTGSDGGSNVYSSLYAE